MLDMIQTFLSFETWQNDRTITVLNNKWIIQKFGKFDHSQYFLLFSSFEIIAKIPGFCWARYLHNVIFRYITPEITQVIAQCYLMAVLVMLITLVVIATGWLTSFQGFYSYSSGAYPTPLTVTHQYYITFVVGQRQGW